MLGANTSRSLLPRLIGRGNTYRTTPVIQTEPGAHHYRLQFLEIDERGAGAPVEVILVLAVPELDPQPASAVALGKVVEIVLAPPNQGGDEQAGEVEVVQWLDREARRGEQVLDRQRRRQGQPVDDQEADDGEQDRLAVAQRNAANQRHTLDVTERRLEAGRGTALDTENFGYNVLGDQAVAPVDMAAAYAAIASNGILCQPKAIDKVVDSMRRAARTLTAVTRAAREESGERVAEEAADVLYHLEVGLISRDVPLARGGN